MDWVTRNCVGLSIITNTNYPNRSFVLLPWLAHAWQQICRAKSVVFKIALTTFRLAIANLKTPGVSRSCEPEYHWLRWSSLRLQGSTLRYPFSFSKLQRGEPRGGYSDLEKLTGVRDRKLPLIKYYSVRDDIAAGGFLNKTEGIQRFRPMTVAKEVLAIANTPRYKR